MREDMGKIITERERRGSSLPSLKTGCSIRWNGFDAEYDHPKRQSASQGRQYGYGEGKEFTDVLGPLRRWVGKQVGRPWNKVYSEICQVIDKRKVTHAHVLDHLYNWVCRNPFRDTKGVWRERGRAYYTPEFIVHPRTGLLVRPRVKPEDHPKAPIDSVKLTDLSEYRKLNGIWYCMTYRQPTQLERTLRGPYLVVVEKRQLGKKELRALETTLESTSSKRRVS
jgi:hypothetical protein